MKQNKTIRIILGIIVVIILFSLYTNNKQKEDNKDNETTLCVDWIEDNKVCAGYECYIDCTETENKVCGNDGITYKNECYACTNIDLISFKEGAC